MSGLVSPGLVGFMEMTVQWEYSEEEVHCRKRPKFTDSQTLISENKKSLKDVMWSSCSTIRQTVSTLVPWGCVPSPFNVKQGGTLCRELVWQCEAQPQLCQNICGVAPVHEEGVSFMAEKHVPQTTSVLS